MFTTLEFIDEPIFQHITKQMSKMNIGGSPRTTLEDVEQKKSENSYANAIYSIDIGVKHLGFAMSLVDEDWNLMEICWIDLIDITDFRHNRVHKKDCKLHHDKTFCDWLEHVFQEEEDFFEKADYILLERQPPPQGFVVVEQLIFAAFRHKAILVHPASVHKFFNIGEYDYEGRKEMSEKIAKYKLKDSPHLLEQLGFYDRQHDICDAICMALYWIDRKQKEYEKERKRKEILERNMYYDKKRKEGTITIDEMFESWRYVPK